LKRAIVLLSVGFVGGFVATFASPKLSGAEAPMVAAPRALAARVNAVMPAAAPVKQSASPNLLLANLGATAERSSPCPADMVSIEGKYCIDRYEAGLVEVGASSERAWPHNWPVDGHSVRAVSKRGIFPQSYISGKEAASACKASGKRLCKAPEWKQACMGPGKSTYPYGASRQVGRCNDNGKSPIARTTMLGGSPWSWENMNQPVLTTLADTVAPSGAFDDCVSGYGVHDMVGNVHEWIDDPNGTFLGGYFQDVELNGHGCGYKTDAHEFAYHDYSTGFRCCADAK